MPQTLRNHLSRKPSISQFAPIAVLLATVLFASGAFAAAPDIVVDAQLAAIGGLNQPQSIAMAPNNTYYVADSGNNRVEAYVNGTASTVSTGTYTLVNPEAVAVDSLGDLFIGDNPSSGAGRVIEALATGGVLNGTVNQVVMGSPLQQVSALTVDTNPASSTFNTLYIGDGLSNAIYTVAAGSTTLTPLSLPRGGLPSGIIPTAILKDSSGNLFVADLLTTLYEVSAGSKKAVSYSIPDFPTLYSPTGLALDPQGNLYILTETSETATPSQTVAENVVKVPFAGGSKTYATKSAYRIPLTNSAIANGSGIAFDSLGDLYVADWGSNDIFETILPPSPISLSEVGVNTIGSPVTLNYELNTANKLRGFKLVSTGDNDSAVNEIQDEGGGCGSANYSTGNDGGTISPSDPFICQESFAADPQYPGLRYGAIELKGTDSTILASTPVYSIGSAGAAVLYPMHAATGAAGIDSPVGLAVSGLDKELYIVDNGATPQILSTNLPGTTAFTQVSTAPTTLSDPLGIAINGEGDLYVADSGLGDVVVVPANTAVSPYTLNPGNLLQHPLSVAFDTDGDLFIGDAGPSGTGADASSPGFIVEVPVGGGAPFEVNTGGITLIYPQALAADPYSGDLIVGDRGAAGGPGQVVDVAAGGGTATVTTPGGVTDPVGIAFDPAEEYYVLDGDSSEITVVRPPALGLYTYTIDTTSALIANPSALAITSGGESFEVANHSSTGLDASNDIIYLNGKADSVLRFGGVKVGNVSGELHARINNIGTSAFTLQTPYYLPDLTGTQFSVANSTSCFSTLQLTPASPCDLYYQFLPTSTGLTTETLTYYTNAYIPTTTLELRGTGR